MSRRKARNFNLPIARIAPEQLNSTDLAGPVGTNFYSHSPHPLASRGKSAQI
ncbi:MAG: hypothetical protein KA004_14060 [Verrucomicrobiales bacterium]|nr:hypothetical protein [Verrucomicrobiales bacterium]